MFEGFKEFILFLFSSYGDIIYPILGFFVAIKFFVCLFIDEGFSDTKNSEESFSNTIKDIYIDKNGNWIEVFRD